MQIEKGAQIDDITTFSINLTNSKTKRPKMGWWRFKRTIGKEGDHSSTRDVERKEIKKAASKLPGAHWDKVESVRLSVAFPKPHNGMNSWKPFGANGLISIGLPTKVKTGTPVWLNGPFHGNIARTEIDLVSEPYNELIFRHLVDLFWTALNYLKQSDNLKTKRSVVLYFEHTEGHLARTIEKKVKWSELNVVLSSDGHQYYRPKDLSIPSIEDMKIFEEIFSKINDLEYYGFRLPDNLIMKNARSLLEHLAEDNDIAVSNNIYLKKKSGGYSLIEQAAASNLPTGREFWESFLNWIAETFDYESLYDFLFLPVEDNEIEKPNKKVFFRPLMRKTERDELVKQLKEDDEEIIEDINDTVFSGLGFFDERCVAVRRGEGKNPYALTDLARKLSPDTGIQLVRRPRKPELINDVLGPRLCEICVNEKDKQSALSILKQIGDWMASMRKQNKDLVRLNDLVVPVAGRDGGWKWIPPTKVYMGNGWLNDSEGRLLEEAYGLRENARLVPWQEFFDNLDDSEKGKSNWLNRMEALGVAKSPRIMVAEPGGPAPLKSWSYNRLSIEEGIPCPVEGGKEYWESYLDRVRHRKCSTKSGQAFYIRDIIWIDGLEIPESRASVLELVLLNSIEYMIYLTADVQRRDGGDRKSGFPSLWIFAIQHNKWEIIPSNLGPLSHDKVWLLGMEDQRRVFVREQLMPFVPDAFKDAWTILRAIGVFAPEEAPSPRIIETLQDVAANINFLKTENYRALKAYVRALYEWLDASFSRDEDRTIYENLLFRPVPLLQGGELESIDLQNLSVVYIEDDSQRSRFIPGFDSSFSLPLRAGGASKGVFDAFSDVLGEERVQRTSTANIETGFLFSDEPNISLLGYLEKEVGEKRNFNIISDLGVLIAFGRSQQPMNPKKEDGEFKKVWDRLKSTKIHWGTFRDSENGHIVIFDERHEIGPILQVAKHATPEDVLFSCWQIFGPAYRDLWAAFTGAVKTSERERFFSERQIGFAERDEVSAVIQHSTIHKLLAIQSLLYTIWRKTNSEVSVDRFKKIWKTKSGSLDEMAEWIGIDSIVLAKLLDEAQGLTSEEDQAHFLNRLEITVSEWQIARVELGLKKIHFSQTIKIFEITKKYLLAYLMVDAARKQTIDLDADEVEKILNDGMEFQGIEKIAKALGAFKHKSSRILGGIKSGKYRRKEIDTYFAQDERQRSVDAAEALNNLLKVAQALAEKKGESFEKDELKKDIKVAAFSDGWWASRFAVLRAAGKALFRLVPETAKALSKKRAFYPPRPWQELWKKFPELGLPSKDEIFIKPVPKVTILNTTKTETKFDEDLMLGSSGEIGALMIQHMNISLDMASLINREREKVAIEWINRGRRTRGGGGGHANNKEKEQNGLLGEIFAYETFRQVLPGFDYSCWVSENREKYGFEAPSEAGRGYDFVYFDSENIMTGQALTNLCFIEVKSSGDDGLKPFPMTTNEWACAKECYDGNEEAVYIIVRVKNVRTSPEIFDIIVDPVKHWHEGRLAIENKDIYIQVSLKGVEG
jgi:hypothetical protein